MKKIYFSILLILGGVSISTAQQYVQYTQFMFNKIALNPAYAGSKGGPTFSTLYRTQWVNFNGAPVSQSFSGHLPIFNDRVGIGLSVHHDKIGPSNSWFYNFQYAYRLPIRKGHLALGIQSVLRNYRVKWQEVPTIHSGDPTYGEALESKLLPNVGAGAYYHTENFYTGLSMPRILRGDLTFSGIDLSTADFTKEERHTLFMLGGIIPINDQLKIKADGLLKHTITAPLDFDIHAGVILLDLLNIGVTYRYGGFTGNNQVVTSTDPNATPIRSVQTSNPFGESVDFVLQILFSEQLKLGLAYDYSLSQVREYSKGTYELMLEYNLGKKSFGLSNPRFF